MGKVNFFRGILFILFIYLEFFLFFYNLRLEKGFLSRIKKIEIVYVKVKIFCIRKKNKVKLKDDILDKIFITLIKNRVIVFIYFMY